MSGTLSCKEGTHRWFSTHTVFMFMALAKLHLHYFNTYGSACLLWIFFMFYSHIILIKIRIVQTIDLKCFHFIKQPQWKPYINYNENVAHLPCSIALKSLKKWINCSVTPCALYNDVTNIYCKSKTSLRLHHQVVT